ncbi:hypothetical protein AAIP73_002764 [Yersinia ruckeri]|uniref:hypothetical protein n=1 Tax=Yersinia ruckeri TaxID=29486 RepID=UPI002237B8D1|nr:hypothetical protein [Yersinia ruckeri]EKN4700066.1 hypothetical protein [Yersinia ruckeri]ELM3747792.1 hypothetical protein [Yersinia ruckeri]MCW6632896.1 hypothetical protein [Yersinia ruckeri]MCW6636888.1 hypothetical protein [Yersinia ruckeri]MCW6651471.1 hypothetical protein [Yersinia ruckeri]
MNTQTSRPPHPESTERYEEKETTMSTQNGIAKKSALSRAFDNAIQEVAMAEEAHAHYGETFCFRDAVHYWLFGFFSSFKKH